MQLCIGRVFFYETYCAYICRYKRIRPQSVYGFQEIGQAGYFLIVRYNITGNMHLYAVLMGVFYAFFQVFLAEIRRGGAHTELLARKVNRVRSVINGGAKPRKVARGAQKLGNFIYRQSSCSPF